MNFDSLLVYAFWCPRLKRGTVATKQIVEATGSDCHVGFETPNN